MKDKPLRQRAALVTGAGRGIGREIALALGAAGARVLVASRTAAELDVVARELAGLGAEAVGETGDLREPDVPGMLVRAAEERFGRLDVLVNNAGTAGSAKVTEVSLAEWEDVIRVNLTAPFLACREALPGMIRRGWGRIVNVASTAGKVGYPYTCAYTASKHGLVGLTRALAAELATTGVTVNAVCPGFADTRLTEESAQRIAERTGRTYEEAREALARNNPMRRLIRPEEVARAVLFLASPEADAINGQAVNVDGGAVTS